MLQTISTDMPRLRRLRRARKEATKPSRWYYDDPADTGSLYRRRTLAALDVVLDIIKNSPDKNLVDSARQLLIRVRAQLPKTFAEWADKEWRRYRCR
jgi:hypothetical protein